MNCHILKSVTLLNHKAELDYNQVIVISDGIIQWCGPEDNIPSSFTINNFEVDDCKHQLITPGLIDCHTHLVYAGERADEYSKRLEGISYSEIAKQGGGILSTVQQTRQASKQQLFDASLPRVKALQADGVTTIEIKSGYGLDVANEIKMLEVARDLAKYTGLRIYTTFLGAHAVPPEFQNQPQAYVDFICNTMLPAVADKQLADAVDVFCENIAFSVAQTEQIFTKAQALQLPIKCHAEQLSNIGASQLAASMGALSCEHLEFLDKESIKIMAANGTQAVLLPGAFYFLKEKKLPPIALLRKYQVGMAIASDCNPGTSPTTSLTLMMNMACQLFGLTINEAWLGVTLNAAKALGLAGQIGLISPGYAADLVHWSTKSPATVCYQFGYPVPHRTMIAGRWIS